MNSYLCITREWLKELIPSWQWRKISEEPWGLAAQAPFLKWFRFLKIHVIRCHVDSHIIFENYFYWSVKKKKPNKSAFVHTKYLPYLITWTYTPKFPWERNLWLIDSIQTLSALIANMNDMQSTIWSHIWAKK